MVKYLVEKGADVDKTDLNGKPPLHVGAGASEASLELVQFLMSRGLRLSDTDDWGRTALYYASTAQNFDIVDFFLRECFGETRQPQTDLLRALLEAAKGDQLSLVRYLIESGVDAQCTNLRGRNALQEASAARAIVVTDFLLSHGVDLQQADKFGATPVLEASRHGRLENLRRLLKAGGSVSDVNIAGQTALHLAAQGGHKEICRLILEYDADVDYRDKRGWTALHSAASGGHAEIVELLIANTATLDAENMSGQTAQALAEEGGHHDVARFLSERTKVLRGANSDPFAEYQEHRLHSAEVCYNLMATTVQHSTDWTWLDSPIEVHLFQA